MDDAHDRRRARRRRDGPELSLSDSARLRRIDLAELPGPASRALAVRVVPAAERAIRSGHPWVFASSIRSVRGAGAGAAEQGAGALGVTGDPTVIFDRKNRFLAVGLWDPDSQIRVRILSAGEPARIGSELFAKKLDVALARRRILLDDPETTGIRILYGESDGMPGLVVDAYGPHLVLKIYSAAWIPHLPGVVEALDRMEPEGVVLLAARRVVAALEAGVPVPGAADAAGKRGAAALARGPVLLAGELPDTLSFLEHGLRFEAHPLQGHKTGFYLDQRENRALLRARTGRRVLNVFSYTGGFSVAAAAGGAEEVVSVDVSEPPLRQAERHFALNAHLPEVAAAKHRILKGDAFDVMRALAGERARFDTIVVDPPSFAKERGQADGALERYARLTTLALALLGPGGLLVQASCSSRVAADDFFARIHDAARVAGRPLDEMERTGHPVDHPVGIPESAYLKALWGRG